MSASVGFQVPAIQLATH